MRTWEIHRGCAQQAVLAESEAKRNRHAAELETIRVSRQQAEAQLAAAEAKLKATHAALGQVRAHVLLFE